MEIVLHRALDARRTSPSPAAVLPAGHAPPCCDTVAGAVGSAPVLWIDRPLSPEGRGFWAKLEGHNPGGMKDRPALHMVERARERGELLPGGMIVESTSGTLDAGPRAVMLAGITYGHPVTLATDPGLEPIMHRLLTAYGARVDVVTSPHPTGGWQQARRQRVAELLAEHPGSSFPDQYHNPDNVAGYAPLALGLVAQLGRVDVLVCGRQDEKGVEGRRRAPRCGPGPGASRWSRLAGPWRARWVDRCWRPGRGGGDCRRSGGEPGRVLGQPRRRTGHQPALLARAAGETGAAVDGIASSATEQVLFHIYSHLP